MAIFLSLFISIILLVFLSIKVKIHPLFNLIIISCLFGVLSGVGLEQIIDYISKGMANSIADIGLIILFGSLIGNLLEKSKATETISNFINNIFGEKYLGLSLMFTGMLTSLAVYCDSAFTILAPIVKKISNNTKTSLVYLMICLISGLHVSQLMIPPAAGPLAIAKILKVNIGIIIPLALLTGVIIALSGYFLGKIFKNKYSYYAIVKNDLTLAQLPNITISLLPILVPILLMILKTILNILNIQIVLINYLGIPVIAMFIGVLLALFCYIKTNKFNYELFGINGVFGDTVKSASEIILIIGAGGAFGYILQSSQLSILISDFASKYNFGIFIPFIFGMLFRTCIGSGTVALITTSTMIIPLLPMLGLNSELGAILAMLACSSGSMMVLHGNDSFFWLISTMGEIKENVAYKTLPLLSIVQSLTGLVITFILSMIVI